ncbi:BREX system P-loop protein BrxC [candidate division KSB1 bacterium]|nr:BREX system P-loop protein BrxC [candidate division KSB1 bacterium]
MQKIKALFSRRIDRKIEEVIQVDQHDEKIVHQEIEEYVVTDSIKDHFITIYDKIAQYTHEPHRGVGVWISGFFGSGKSSFAKLLGYSLANRAILGKSAAERFIENARDARISNYLQNINSRFKIHPIIFDVSMDRGVRTASERITEVIYKVLLRELNYPMDFDLAEMEMMLESENELADFEKRYLQKYNKDWTKGKKIVTNALNEASFILHELKPQKFSHPDSWLHAIGQQGRADIDANKLAALIFDLAARRKPGQGIIFIIDEVGQYVARSTDKMLDLQAVVQALGKESENRIKVGKAAVPAWIIVTSQEKLNEVVDALDARRIELARLQDRFPIAIDLKQSDIQEVTARRILNKTDEAVSLLGKMFDQYEGRIKTHCALQRTHRKTTLTRTEFIQLYPYLPYQVELSVDIVAGLRLRRGAQRHVGGSNRTIIKQAQQMLIHPNTNLGEQPIGALVTLDQIYELLDRGNLLPGEITSEINAIAQRLPHDKIALKVAKAVTLLEVVRDLPRTVANIAAVLHPTVTADSQEPEVQNAIKRLEEAQFIRETEQGYKLLTVIEKNWDVERRGKSPKDREKHEIIEARLQEIFGETGLKVHRYKNLKTFSVGLTINQRKVNDGSIMIDIFYVDEPPQFPALLENTKRTSRTDEHKNEIFWIFMLNETIHHSLVEYYRSHVMVQEYMRIHSQSHITSEEIACLEDEKHREQRILQQLKKELLNLLQSGTVVFQGVEKDTSLLGQNLSEMMKATLNNNIPQIYPRLDLGARNMSGKEADLVLKSANLNALPALFYAPPDGLDLVIRQGNKYLPNLNAPVVREIFDYQKSQYEYGNQITGKNLENHFEQSPFGWERDLLRLILALLFRAGLVEVSYQGKKYKSYTEPASWNAFINHNIFRSATFAPRKTIDIPVLIEAARYYENITGHEVDVDEMTIATEFKKIAQSDLDLLRQVMLELRMNNLPELELVREFKDELETILNSSSDDCVNTLAGQGATYKVRRDQMAQLKSNLTKTNIDILLHGKLIIQHIWPVLKHYTLNGELENKLNALEQLFANGALYQNVEEIRLHAEAVFNAYHDLYQKSHVQRYEKIEVTIDKLKGDPAFSTLDAAQQQSLLFNFQRRSCHDLKLNWSDRCENCQATLQQLESDILSINGLLDEAIQQIQKLTAPATRPTITISVNHYLRGEFQSADELEQALERLKEEVIKHLLEGKSVYLQ